MILYATSRLRSDSLFEKNIRLILIKFRKKEIKNCWMHYLVNAFLNVIKSTFNTGFTASEILEATIFLMFFSAAISTIL